MVPVASLWLAILVSAVIVFVASSIIHMVLPYHRSDYKKLPDEESARAALRGVPAGLYHAPHCTHDNMKTPEVQQKYKEGPIALISIYPSGPVNMGKFLGLWFVYLLVVAFFTAYVAGHVLAPGAHYLEVYRVVGAVSFMALGLANISNGIWRGWPWGVVSKEVIDGLIYCGLMAGTFGWLWPKA